jgi:hypothetical protein
MAPSANQFSFIAHAKSLVSDAALMRKFIQVPDSLLTLPARLNPKPDKA